MYSASSILVLVMRSIDLRVFQCLVTYRMQVSETADSGECRSELQTTSRGTSQGFLPLRSIYMLGYTFLQFVPSELDIHSHEIT
jgi:hypothetical protein